MSNDWLLSHARKDAQSVTADWAPTSHALIEGVHVRESRSLAKRNGSLTELFRADWYPPGAVVGQVFVVRLCVGGLSAWHAHAVTIDRLAVIGGAATLVLYDARQDSPTNGRVNEFHLHDRRPTVIEVPARVWHGVMNSGDDTCLLANMPDRPYQYGDPDHWRVAADSPEVPYRFERGPAPIIESLS